MKYYGIIKCTYAELFDSDHKKIFSLQAADFGDEKEQQPIISTEQTDGKYLECKLTEPSIRFIQANSDIDTTQTFLVKSCSVELIPESYPDTPIVPEDEEHGHGNIKLIAIAAAALLALRGLLK